MGIILEVLPNRCAARPIARSDQRVSGGAAADAQVLAITGHTIGSNPPPSRRTAGASSRRPMTRPPASGMHGPAQRSDCSAASGSCVSAAFSPEGQRIVTGSYDRTARIWDACDGPADHGAQSDTRTGQSRVLTRRPTPRHCVVGQDCPLWDARQAGSHAAQRTHGSHCRWARSRPTGGASSRRHSTRPHGLGRRDRSRDPAAQRPYGRVATAAFSPDGRRIVTRQATRPPAFGRPRRAVRSGARRPHEMVNCRLLLARRSAHRDRLVR